MVRPPVIARDRGRSERVESHAKAVDISEIVQAEPFDKIICFESIFECAKQSVAQNMKVANLPKRAREPKLESTPMHLAENLTKGSVGAEIILGARQNRSGVSVGYLNKLAAAEAMARQFLRLWSEGADSQGHIWSEFQTALAADNGRSALKSFENLCALCCRCNRHPVMRHHSNCQIIGTDESCFADLVAPTSDGERGDAMLISPLLVHGDIAPGIAAFAAEVDLALKCVGLRGEISGAEPYEFPHIFTERN